MEGESQYWMKFVSGGIKLYVVTAASGAGLLYRFRRYSAIHTTDSYSNDFAPSHLFRCLPCLAGRVRQSADRRPRRWRHARLAAGARRRRRGAGPAARLGRAVRPVAGIAAAASGAAGGGHPAFAVRPALAEKSGEAGGGADSAA